ncbi:hypothetical protein NL501_27100, partial [Klebsiella pneumoniae]|nr:hypothetical protein [Klebsiella pneumoniae]
KQTVGGYTKIATVCQSDLSVLAQKQPGQKVNFEWVTVEEAIQHLDDYNKGFEASLEAIEKEPLFDMREMRTTSKRISELLEGDE